MVRLKPNLLDVLDRFASEIGSTRPEAVRSILSTWLREKGYLPE